MNDKEKIYCACCGSDDPDKQYFQPISCIKVKKGQYICQDCCRKCKHYQDCSLLYFILIGNRVGVAK